MEGSRRNRLRRSSLRLVNSAESEVLPPASDDDIRRSRPASASPPTAAELRRRATRIRPGEVWDPRAPIVVVEPADAHEEELEEDEPLYFSTEQQTKEPVEMNRGDEADNVSDEEGVVAGVKSAEDVAVTQDFGSEDSADVTAETLVDDQKTQLLVILRPSPPTSQHSPTTTGAAPKGLNKLPHHSPVQSLIRKLSGASLDSCSVESVPDSIFSLDSSSLSTDSTSTQSSLSAPRGPENRRVCFGDNDVRLFEADPKADTDFSVSSGSDAYELGDGGSVEEDPGLCGRLKALCDLVETLPPSAQPKLTTNDFFALALVQALPVRTLNLHTVDDSQVIGQTVAMTAAELEGKVSAPTVSEGISECLKVIGVPFPSFVKPSPRKATRVVAFKALPEKASCVADLPQLYSAVPEYHLPRPPPRRPLNLVDSIELASGEAQCVSVEIPKTAGTFFVSVPCETEKRTQVSHADSEDELPTPRRLRRVVFPKAQKAATLHLPTPGAVAALDLRPKPRPQLLHKGPQGWTAHKVGSASSSQSSYAAAELNGLRLVPAAAERL